MTFLEPESKEQIDRLFKEEDHKSDEKELERLYKQLGALGTAEQK